MHGATRLKHMDFRFWTWTIFCRLRCSSKRFSGHTVLSKPIQVSAAMHCSRLCSSGHSERCSRGSQWDCRQCCTTTSQQYHTNSTRDKNLRADIINFSMSFEGDRLLNVGYSILAACVMVSETRAHAAQGVGVQRWMSRHNSRDQYKGHETKITPWLRRSSQLVATSLKGHGSDSAQ